MDTIRVFDGPRHPQALEARRSFTMAGRSILIAGALLGLLFGGSAIAQDKDKGDKPDAKAGKPDAKGKKVTWAVVKIGDDYKVVQEDKIPDMQKDLDNEAKAHKQ